MASNCGTAGRRVGPVMAVALVAGLAFAMSLLGPTLLDPPPSSSFVIDQAPVEAERPPVAVADELPEAVALLAAKPPRPERLALDAGSAPIAAAILPQALPAAARIEPAAPADDDTSATPQSAEPTSEPLLPTPVEPATRELAPGEVRLPPPPEESMRELVRHLPPARAAAAREAPPPADAQAVWSAAPAAAAPQPTATAAPLPGVGWTDPDGANWSEAPAGRRESAPPRAGRLFGRIGDRLGDGPGTTDDPASAGPRGGRLLDRVRDRFGPRDETDATLAAPDAQSHPDATGWPAPAALLAQLTRLAAVSATPPADWATAARSAIDAVVATAGPAVPEADAALLALHDVVEDGMRVADAVSEPTTASQVRRAALAVARRVAVWRAAAATCAADPNGAEGEPATAVATCQLLRLVERFEASRSATDAAAVRAALDAHPAAGRGLERAIGDHYLSPNVRIAIHEEFLERLLPESTVTSGPLQDYVLGRKVRGTKTVEQSIGVRFTPHPSEIRFELLVTGEVSSRTVTEAGSVAIHSRGVSSFTVHKPIQVSPRGLGFGPARGSASNQSQLAGIETGFDAVPLMGPLVRGIVRNQHDGSIDEASREVNTKIVTRACREVDQQTEPRLAEAATGVRDRFWSPMERLGLAPTAVALETAAGVATARLRLAAASQLAAHTPRPRAPEDALFSIQVHESSVNNACERFALAGRKMSLEELTRFVCTELGIPPQIPDDLPEGVEVTFARAEPLRIECRDGLVHVRVALDALEAGRRSNWYDIVGQVAYRPAIDGVQVVLEREGPVQLSGPGHKGRMEFGLRTIFGKMFPKERPVPLVPAKVVTNPRMQGVQAVQAIIADGWLAVALAPVTQAGNGRTSPTASRIDGGSQRTIRR
jgi:hypothetical protein